MPTQPRSRSFAASIPALTVLLLVSCGPGEGVDPPEVVERDWEAVCGDRCAGAPVQVRVGDGYSCVRYEGGTVLCWGIRRGVAEDEDVFAHEGGAVGVPGVTQWPQIEMPTGIMEASDLGAATATTCVASGAEGRLMCWGNLTPTSLVPVPTWGFENVAFLRNHDTVEGSRFCGSHDDGTPFGVPSDWTAPIRECAPGRCLVDLEGELFCWGPNDAGQLGTGEVGPGRFTHHVEELVDVAVVMGEDAYTCAAQRDGQLFCWGDNREGVIGSEPFGRYEDAEGHGLSYKFPSPTKVEGVEDVVRIAGNRVMACALRADGQLFCWGDDWTGIMRLPSVDGTSPNTATATPIPEADDLVDFDVSFNHGCVIRRSGEVACWGSDYHGAIGPEPSHVPFGHLQTVRGLPSH